MSWTSQFQKILMLRCAEATELSSWALDEPLALTDRMALHGHLWSCGSCRRFHRQLRSIHVAIQRRDEFVLREEAATTGQEETLSREARDRIARAIEERTGDKLDRDSDP
jgi:hypothetical protein